MRAEKSNEPDSAAIAADVSSTTRRPNDYSVAPIYVHDLTSQCAAHFLAWFVTMSPEHVRDVVECGQAAGGFADEVGWWIGQCEQDVESADNGLGYWPLEDNGPWVYENIDPVDIATLVRLHTDGWSNDDFYFYGYTVEEKARLVADAADFQTKLGEMLG